MTYETCIVFLLGYPGMGKRTVGSHLAELLDAVLVDNQLINRPLLELFRWDGKEQDEQLRVHQCSYGRQASADQYDSLRSLARRRDSLFLAVMLTCDIDVQVSRIDNPDRVALRKGSDPEGYRWHRLNTRLFEPPAGEVIHIDTTEIAAQENAAAILGELIRRGLRT